MEQHIIEIQHNKYQYTSSLLAAWISNIIPDNIKKHDLCHAEDINNWASFLFCNVIPLKQSHVMSFPPGVTLGRVLGD